MTSNLGGLEDEKGEGGGWGEGKGRGGGRMASRHGLETGGRIVFFFISSSVEKYERIV